MSPENRRACHYWFESWLQSRTLWFWSRCPWFLSWCTEFWLLGKDPWRCIGGGGFSCCSLNHSCAGYSWSFGLRGSSGCRFFVDHKLCKRRPGNRFQIQTYIIYIALAHLADAFVQSDLLMRQFDLTTFSSPQPPLPRLIYVNPDKIN